MADKGKGKGRAVSNVIKYGVKYGPHVVAAVKVAKDPAQNAARKVFSEGRARRAALEHAHTLVGGSVLKVIHRDAPVWVIFSGEDAITTQPKVDVPIADLLMRADLTRRISPDDVPGTAGKAKAALTRGKRALTRKP